MKLRELFDDDNAVSPVIGVILMVAITVILAAVVASFVLGLGDQAQQATPQATFEFEFADDVSYTPSYTGASTYTVDELVVTHAGGDSISNENLVLQTSGTYTKYVNDAGNLGGDGYQPDRTFNELGTSSDVSAGTSVRLLSLRTDYSSNPDVANMNGVSASVIYQSDSGDSSATLAEWSGPDA